jgi:hypothetical protein
MTNNENNFYAAEFINNRYSHKNCTHPSTAAHRHNCRLDAATKGQAEMKALRAARTEPLIRPNLDTNGKIIISNMN